MNQIIKQISHIGIVSVTTIDEAEKAVPLTRTLVAGGLPAAEMTFRTAAGEGTIRRIATEVPEMLVGTGAALTTGQAGHAIATGAQFIVGPGSNPVITRYVIDRGMLMMPGTANPGEIEQAMSMELDMVKFSPAEQNNGVAKLRALANPYTNLRWIPTGGVNTRSLMDYLNSDRIVACGGTWMIKGDLIEDERWDETTRICREAVQTILSSELRHMDVNCDDRAEAGKTTRIFCALFQLPCRPGNSSVSAGSVVECMKSPYPGKHGYVAIGINDVGRTIYHLDLRSVASDETIRKADRIGKTKAIYLDGEVGDFVLQLTQK